MKIDGNTRQQAVGFFGAILIIVVGGIAWTFVGGHILLTREGKGIILSVP